MASSEGLTSPSFWFGLAWLVHPDPQVRTIAEQRIYLDEAHELHDLLTTKWIQALLEVHDEVAAHIQNSLEEVKYIDGVSSNEDSGNEEEDEKEAVEEGEEKEDSGEEIVDTFRVIGLRRKAGESLVGGGW